MVEPRAGDQGPTGGGAAARDRPCGDDRGRGGPGVRGDLRDLLADLATYLEQQQRAGGRFFFEDGRAEGAADGAAVEAAPAEAAAASESEIASSSSSSSPSSPSISTAAVDSAGGPAPPPRPEPSPPKRPEKPRSPEKAAREEAFQRECAAFVRDALTLIARSRGVGSASQAPAQSGLFEAGAPAGPVAPGAEAVDEAVPADPAAELAALGDEVRACTACGLHAGRLNAVPGAGHPRATLMLVGEAPGQAEDEQGLPFVGRSGRLLTDILRAIGFAREDVFIGNVLKCRPPQNRDPERDEVTACEPYLRRQIRIIQPRIILCLGRVAAHTLLGTTASLRDLRSSVHFFAGVPVMATYHPAALLRNPSSKRDAWDDVRKVRALHDALASGD
ncbi:uracil-DNA glycosylase [bacterium]|nr:uracil-DNA glycosylase [bacterium]